MVERLSPAGSPLLFLTPTTGPSRAQQIREQGDDVLLAAAVEFLHNARN